MGQVELIEIYAPFPYVVTVVEHVIVWNRIGCRHGWLGYRPPLLRVLPDLLDGLPVTQLHDPVPQPAQVTLLGLSMVPFVHTPVVEAVLAQLDVHRHLLRHQFYRLLQGISMWIPCLRVLVVAT